MNKQNDRYTLLLFEELSVPLNKRPSKTTVEVDSAEGVVSFVYRKDVMINKGKQKGPGSEKARRSLQAFL